MPTVLTASMNEANLSSMSSAFSALSPSISSLSPLSSSASSLDSVYSSVRHLLSRALSLPCSTAAQAFTQLVQPTLRFQLALDALLPLLDGNWESGNSSLNIDGHDRNQTAQRILVSFILFSLYAPHPVSINPFRSALYMTFVNEREKAIRLSNSNANGASTLGNGGGTGSATLLVAGTASNDQLVWVLWKILRGDGNDIGPYTPTTLARSPLPPKLAAINLILDEADDNDLDTPYSYGNRASYGSSSNSHTDGNVLITKHIAPSEDLENVTITRGMTLILAARERVLSLSERRTLDPILPALAALDVITPLDLASIVTLNSDVAYPLFVEMLIASISSPSNYLELLEILPYLPPSLSTFDIMGRLLRDTRLIPFPPAIPLLRADGYHDDQISDNDERIPLKNLVYSQVLGRFIHECIERLEREERERLEGPGGNSDGDDAWGRGVRNLCRFYLSLIKLNIVALGHRDYRPSPPQTQTATFHVSDDWESGYDMESFSAESVEIGHFALRNSRFQEARILYGALVTGRLDG
ncbi:hypothetical protein D9757_007313 [Collybiopsis confluens]|uniref:CCR4-NOT transcription complex subunit 11 n=1 Tax=Collybiopsis confluens TaxID=2823264 RepID=A0A8H5HG80_9AGAR|nr:hypothetical protein D9757_007313 [Collybiopsis confluens]